MNILSIDPGIDKMGWAIFRLSKALKHNYILSGLIKTNPAEDAPQRIGKIYEELQIICKKHNIKQIVFEELFLQKNVKTAQIVYQVQGVIILLAYQLSIPVQKIQPLKIKLTITGYGKSDKKAVKKMLHLQYPFLTKIVQDDQLDAIACGYTYCLTK